MIMGNSKNIPARNTADEPTVFNGYTLQELRYQRALASLKKEFAKEKALAGLNAMKEKTALGRLSGKVSSLGKAGGLLPKVLSSLNYADYAMLGFSVFGTVRKVWKFFKRKK